MPQFFSTGVVQRSGRTPCPYAVLGCRFTPDSVVTCLCRSPPVWAVTVAHFCFNWGYYTLLAWLPSYFELALGLNVERSSFLTLIPYIAMTAMMPLVGPVADGWVKAGVPLTRVRKIAQVGSGSSTGAWPSILSGGEAPVDMFQKHSEHQSKEKGVGTKLAHGGAYASPTDRRMVDSHCRIRSSTCEILTRHTTTWEMRLLTVDTLENMAMLPPAEHRVHWARGVHDRVRGPHARHRRHRQGRRRGRSHCCRPGCWPVADGGAGGAHERGVRVGRMVARGAVLQSPGALRTELYGTRLAFARDACRDGTHSRRACKRKRSIA